MSRLILDYKERFIEIEGYSKQIPFLTDLVNLSKNSLRTTSGSKAFRYNGKFIGQFYKSYNVKYFLDSHYQLVMIRYSYNDKVQCYALQGIDKENGYRIPFTHHFSDASFVSREFLNKFIITPKRKRQEITLSSIKIYKTYNDEFITKETEVKETENGIQEEQNQTIDH